MKTHARTIPGRLDPLHCLRRLRGEAPAVLLDGQPTPGPDRQRALLFFDPFDLVRVEAGSDRAPQRQDPLALLFERLRDWRGGSPSATGSRCGAAGFLAYDLGRHLESLPDSAGLDSAVPDLWFGLFNRVLEIDVASGAGTLFVTEIEQAGRSGAAYVTDCFARAERALRSADPAPDSGPATVPPGPSLRSNFSSLEYVQAVEHVRELIRAGEVYQVNLSQRFETPYCADPTDLYSTLRGLNPAPFSAFVDTGREQLLSSSPERFLLLEGDRVETRPIKGTRRRSGDPTRDRRTIEELMATEKDAAELAMIVDLERNDLGRVARFGTVEVVEPARLLTCATVFHREAVIRARLAPGAGAEELLRAAFPGGSITGAPKIRAMEVIEELEGVRRGIFTGSIGWIGLDGDLDLNIAIRTLVLEQGRAHFHAGGGVVLDSDPEAEYEETLAKGLALARALGGDLPAGIDHSSSSRK